MAAPVPEIMDTSKDHVNGDWAYDGNEISGSTAVTIVE
jgi:hypothetical protein